MTRVWTHEVQIPWSPKAGDGGSTYLAIPSDPPASSQWLAACLLEWLNSYRLCAKVRNAAHFLTVTSGLCSAMCETGHGGWYFFTIQPGVQGITCVHQDWGWTKPDAMTEWVEHLSLIQVSRTLAESNQWLKIWYLPLPSLAFVITRIGQGAVEWGRPTVHNWNFSCLINWCTTTTKF